VAGQHYRRGVARTSTRIPGVVIALVVGAAIVLLCLAGLLAFTWVGG